MGLFGMPAGGEPPKWDVPVFVFAYLLGMFGLALLYALRTAWAR